MAEYRFIAFPKGFTPTAKEVKAFRGYAEMLNDRVAYGKQRDDAGLAICCLAEPFDRLRELDPKFAGLLARWEKQGVKVTPTLPFSRDKQPWRAIEAEPKKQAKQEAKPTPATDGRSLEQKRAAAQRAEAVSRLAADREQERGRAFQRWAGVLPYALWAAGGFTVLIGGGYLVSRLSDAGGESRAEAIERVAGDALGEPLEQQPTANDGSPEDAT